MKIQYMSDLHMQVNILKYNYIQLWIQRTTNQ